MKSQPETSPALSWKAQFKAQWSQASGLTRAAIWLLGVAQLPLVFLIFNRGFCAFEVDSAPYFLMSIIERVKSGGQIYVPPGPGYASPSYTPFYFWVSAAICEVLGSSLIYPRLVSLLSTFWLMCLVGALVWKNTKNLLLTLAAPCFTIGRSNMDPWFVDINVNMLFGALGVAGFYILRSRFSVMRVMAAALVLSLCTLTKQTGLGFLVAAAVMVAFHRRSLTVTYVLVAVAVVGGICVWQNKVTDGQFLASAVGFTTLHEWEWRRLWSEVFFPDLTGMYGLLLAMTLVPLFSIKRSEFWTTVMRPEYVMCGAGILVAILAQPKAGSGSTQALVAYAGLSVCGCMGIHYLASLLPSNLRVSVPAWLVALQTLIFVFPMIPVYRYRIIDQGDRDQYRQVAEVFRAGRTAFFSFAYLPTLFGQPDNGQYGDESTMWKDGHIEFNEPRSINEPFYRQEYDFVILPTYGDQRDPTVQAILENYKAVRKLPGHPRGTFGGNARWEKIVFQANRFFPEAMANPATNPAAPTGSQPP